MKVRVKYTGTTEAFIDVPETYRDDPEEFIASVQMPLKSMEQAEWVVDKVEVIEYHFPA